MHCITCFRSDFRNYGHCIVDWHLIPTLSSFNPCQGTLLWSSLTQRLHWNETAKPQEGYGGKSEKISAEEQVRGCCSSDHVKHRGGRERVGDPGKKDETLTSKPLDNQARYGPDLHSPKNMDYNTISNSGWDISSVSTVHWHATPGKKILDTVIIINSS